MKKILFLLHVIVFIIFIYISFAYVFNINALFIPDFWLIIIFFAGLYLEEKVTFSLVFILGILKDIFEIGIFGMNSFLFLIIIFLFKYMLNKIYRDSFINILFFIFLASLIYYFLKYCLYNIWGYKVIFGYIYLFKAILVSIVAPFIFNILIKQENWLYKTNVAE